MDKIKHILKFAMRMEKNTGDFYDFYMDKAVSEEIRKLFEELVEIEKQHFNVLKEKYDELGSSEPLIEISWVVDENFKEKDPHILADNSDLLPELNADVLDISVIRMAYLIETDFAHFYSKAAAAVETPEIKKLLSELAGWEKQHSDMFYQKYLALLDKNWRDIRAILE
ncbi:MAG: ferritin family protein [Firmicutes bacterium]|nr:ferritin family protein [Bacillota bacterium]